MKNAAGSEKDYIKTSNKAVLISNDLYSNDHTSSFELEKRFTKPL